MNTINKTLSLSLCIVLAGFSLPSTAQSPNMPMRGPMPLSAFDTNGDGFISEEEFNAMHARRMAAREAQGRPARRGYGPPPFSAFDLDGDGKLTQSELDQARSARMQNRRGMRSGMSDGRGMRSGMSDGRGMGYGPCRGMRGGQPSFSRYDLDGDGVITEAEFRQAHQRPRGRQQQ